MVIKLGHKAKILFALIATFLSSWSWAGNGPIPVNPQERAFFDYLTRIAKIRFADNLQPDPWITCENKTDSSTFYSASLFQFTPNYDIQKNVTAWVSNLFDHAYWASIRMASCTFDISHFNECFAKGSFSLYFRNNRVVSFYEKASKTWCENR